MIDQSSPLYKRLQMPIEGRCVDCDCWTENRDYENDEWICEACNAKTVAAQELDKRLDDPRRN